MFSRCVIVAIMLIKVTLDLQKCTDMNILKAVKKSVWERIVPNYQGHRS